MSAAAQIVDPVAADPAVDDQPTRDPRWARPALLLLLLGTAALYIVGLGASGWANAYYSAAAQAATQSWSALFYGALDGAGSITVDKTPASLWVMGISARIFALSSWSILVPEALMGVAAVGLLYATVRRSFPAGAALLAGAVMALTPVAALMFRFNNPDALLVLLLVAAAYATVRAIEKGSARWVVLVGVLVGFAFLTKMLQSLLVVPALALAYLIFAPVSVRRRCGHLLLAGLAMVVSAGWWVAIVELVPASSRPYIGGSQTNSILELTLGYNGFGRLNGSEVGSVGGGMGRRGMELSAGAGGMARDAMGGGMGMAWGQSGWSRLFDAENAAFVAWLLPAACILLVAGLWATRRAATQEAANRQGSAQRAAFVMWGGWLVVTALVFSFMQGIYHSYYTVALAPAIGAVVGMGGAALWARRGGWAARVVLAVTVALTAVWSAVLLGGGGESYAWLRYPVLVVGLGAAVALLVVGRLGRRIATGVAVLAVASALTAPAAYAVSTAATPHTGAIPSVGSSGMGGPGGHHFGHRGSPFGHGGATFGPSGVTFGQGGVMFGPGGSNGPDGTADGQGGMRAGEFGMGMRGGPMGGLLGAAEPSKKLVDLLKKDSGSFTWVAATVGANNAAGYQLAARAPVMAIGGFNGSDPAPTLAQFKQWVAQGRIHYFLGGGRGMPHGMGLPNGLDNSQEITEWVTSTFSQVTIDGVVVVDLSSPR